MYTELEKQRFLHGDIDEDYPILTDEQYEYFISEFKSEKKRYNMIEMVILKVLSSSVHERSGQEERRGNQAFDQRLRAYEAYKRNNTLSGANIPVIIGGTSNEEMMVLATDPDRVVDTFYKGQSNGQAEWQTRRKYWYCGNIEPHNFRNFIYRW